MWLCHATIIRGLDILLVTRGENIICQVKKKMSTLDIGHVHVLLYAVKFNGEIDIVQFIFTRCVVYYLEQKLSLHKKVEK